MEYALSLGTNIGDRLDNLRSAIASINLVPCTRVVKCSSVYETEPVGYAEQDDFYNIAVLVESELEPNEILGMCLGIEAGFNRVRNFKDGPRILDIDVIFCEGKEIQTKNLTVPHPRCFERRFVLEPLLELLPDGEFYGINFKKYIEKIEGQAIRIACKLD